MDYKESRAWIDEAQKYGAVLGLGNEIELLHRLGDPQKASRFIHVAGTNGKGSVIAYLYTTLTLAGYKMGRYTSPTLYSYRERIEVNHEPITREAYARIMTRIREVIEGMTAEGLPHATPFEIETAAAFMYFKETGCELVLLEVGMGGETDATNVIDTTLLAVLVSISIDHAAFLGNTLAAIAGVKSGIIKEGCRVVTSPQADEALEVIRAKACSMHASLYEADPDQAESLEMSYAGQTFRYRGEIWQIPLGGTCQKENAVTALTALDALEELGYPVDTRIRQKGLRETVWNGRFTRIHEKPLFFVDGAHNPGAALRLKEACDLYFPGKKLILVIGIFRDKDVDFVLKTMTEVGGKIICTQTPGNPRALPADELLEKVLAYTQEAEACPDLKQAVDRAFELASEEDVILSFGSLSNIGAITALVRERA